ncbi:AMP-binding protein [Thermodesulfobacteriota bacterium]
MLIGDFLRLNAGRFQTKLAFKDENKQITFDEANQHANGVANALLAMGLKKGDRVAVLLYDCTEYFELIFALPKAGLVIVPLNYRLVGRELAYIINNAEAAAIIFGEDFHETVNAIGEDLKTVRNTILVGNKKAKVDILVNPFDLSRQMVRGEVLVKWALQTPKNEVIIFKDSRIKSQTLYMMVPYTGSSFA